MREIKPPKMEKCATGGGRNQKLKLKKHALPAIEAVIKEVELHWRKSCFPLCINETSNIAAR